MLSFLRRSQQQLLLQPIFFQQQLQRAVAFAAAGARGKRLSPFSGSKKGDNNSKSEWWIVDGEMHEIGDNVSPRERFVIPRDNIPNKRRKQMRDQFMRRTRLVLKESVRSLLPLLFLPTSPSFHSISFFYVLSCD
ncbi:hypothetical protein ACLOJK_024177 [Asimina triloba]